MYETIENFNTFILFVFVGWITNYPMFNRFRADLVGSCTGTAPPPAVNFLTPTPCQKLLLTIDPPLSILFSARQSGTPLALLSRHEWSSPSA
jgi:hypothetical protein